MILGERGLSQPEACRRVVIDIQNNYEARASRGCQVLGASLQS
jgi:hypothetical protein